MAAIQQILASMGGVAAFTFNATISSNTTNYNIKSAAIAAGWDGLTQLVATVTINSGVIVGGAPAFDTGASFPTGSSLALINNGSIMGSAGGGGSGFQGAGGAGSLAFRAQAPISISNNGTIGGGGGGGGAGGDSNYVSDPYSGSTVPLLGGAGGAGQGPSGGPYGGSAGQTGGGRNAGTGGYGGSLGASGAAGLYGSPGVYPPGPGGSGGAAISGNANITWVATGARYGAIS